MNTLSRNCWFVPGVVKNRSKLLIAVVNMGSVRETNLRLDYALISVFEKERASPGKMILQPEEDCLGVHRNRFPAENAGKATLEFPFNVFYSDLKS